VASSWLLQDKLGIPSSQVPIIRILILEKNSLPCPVEWNGGVNTKAKVSLNEAEILNITVEYILF
jgi:hypothetical protein